MKKWISTVILFLSLLVQANEERPWRPVQYYLEWTVVKDSQYYIYHRATSMNVITNHTDWSMWIGYPFRYTNIFNVFQGCGYQYTQYFVVASNVSQTKTSNIVGWPPNLMNSPATGDVQLKLVRTPVGPPFYYGPSPYPSLNLRMQ